MVEITSAEQNIEKRIKRNEDSLRDLWDNIKHTNIRIVGVPEGEKRKKEKEFESIGQILADEIFTSMEGYAIKGVENEVTPNKKKPKPYDIVDI